MVARLASGLKKLPSEVRKSMTLPEVYDLFDHWRRFPPEHELLAIALRVYTTWRPAEPAMTPEEREIAHLKSLEERWAAGYMNVKQMFEAGGGTRFATTAPGEIMPGIGPFPGAIPAAQAAAH
jgi:hypothetical protein